MPQGSEVIALDTNALLRLLVEDDAKQAAAVQRLVLFAKNKSIPLLILPEELLVTVWLFESVHNCDRNNRWVEIHSIIIAGDYLLFAMLFMQLRGLP
jgi:predicted nucleic-acid-binding protein